MPSRMLLAAILVLAMSGLGCGFRPQSAPAPPFTAQVTPSPAPRVLSPTAARTAAATISPATPTRSGPSAVPVLPTATIAADPTTPPATPAFDPEELYGTWARFDAERGDLFITFAESGRYSAAHGTPSGIVRTGSYMLDGALLTFTTWDDCPAGRYEVRVVSDGTALVLLLQEDECRGQRGDRVEALANKRWVRSIAP
jgi:hypothetical protein